MLFFSVVHLPFSWWLLKLLVGEGGPIWQPARCRWGSEVPAVGDGTERLLLLLVAFHDFLTC